ncbi:MAG: HYR domain-containing protein [Saprospiraceae bacterium]|nr:HYR domain-containing protein [Saprospiraceae bacterium]MBK7737087.1 HYR domain-containing protein [Saprospiraceae bacterium]MBK7914318.1 HYR domain-containing protein [Saprospiraceae bacterium]
MNNFLAKNFKVKLSSLLLILSSSLYLSAQTFTGSIINTAGNSLIPSTGTGGCTVAPQTTGGTLFNNVVSGLSGTCVRLSSIQVNFTHTFDSDIDMYLRSPTGQIIELSTDNGAGNDNFTNTIFCDTSCVNITAGAPPYTGIFKPEGTLTASACGVTITPTVQSLNAFSAANGTWQLVIIDDVGADAGVMLAWSMNFENIADIVGPVGTTIVPMAPGTCTPLGGIACLAPVITSCARTNNGIFYSLANLTNQFDKCAYTRCNGTVTFPGAGVYRIFWLSLNGCAIDTARQFVTVLDAEPPTIMGCPKAVNINLGPGECEAAWDAPPFMAMDNCPFSGPLTTSPGCNLGANNFLTATGFNIGLMFSIQNTSAQLMRVRGLSFMPYTGFGNIYRVYTTIANTGYLPVANNPAAWVQVANDMMKTGQNVFPPPNPRLLTQFDLTTVINIPPGETRGMAIYGGPVSVSQYYVNAAAPCSTTLQGDANLKIDVRDGRVQYGVGYFVVAGTFNARMFNGNVDYSLGSDLIPLVQTCGQPYGPGSYFPIGCKTLCYEATDAAGNKTTCQFDVCVIPYANTVTALACHDEIQISLDENCTATIGADEVLAGGPYRCYNDYTVEARDWITNAIVDRQPNVPGVQVSSQDIGRELKLTVRDPRTGNSCWGHATVEDKLPPTLICRDTCVPCHSGITPFYTGTPVVRENCSSYSLTYYDDDTQGSCALGYDRVIIRVWTATDPYGNRARCNQRIQVSLGTLADVAVPASRDNVDAPMLNCNEKIYDKDVTPHYLAYPYCVDGYLLDSAHWFATGGFLPSPNGDLAGERLPRILGWNCLDSGPFTGHPSPFPVYYPAHPSWRANNPVCWGPDEVVMWEGTGYPGNAACRNLGVTYNDITIDLRTPGCDAGPIGCFKIIRQWTVADWCTGLIGGHNQIIKVGDGFGPEILYPDTVNVNMEVWTCTGRWEVPPAWLRDNCSNEIHYSVRVDDGTVLGDETNGYVVINMPVGVQNGYIVATDCCGNQTKRRIALNVFDNVPPVAVCEQKTIVSINGNQSPGENFAKVFAESFDQGSFDNCQPHIFFKVIRMEHLRGTNNGSNANQADNGTNCAGINGDDNPLLDGNQIYFDDHVKFCCSDVGNTVMVVFRVFDREPGVGPIPPNRMNQGGVLYNRFSDCMVEVEVQDKSVPTVVPPPNIVVSCWFWFDVDKIDDPNDPTFGRVVTDLGDRHKVVTNDLVCYKYCVRNDYTGYPGYVPGAPPSNPPAWNRACDYYRSLFDTAHYDRKYELVWGFDGYVLSACGNTPTISVNDNRECGQGQITRTIVARGPNGVSVTGTQIIWVVDCDPFYINGADNCDPDDDITWPGNCTGQATTIDGCGADISPDNPLLGRPVVENGADDLCALISIEYVDEIFTIEPDACFKVLRHWTVIDWCQYDPSIDPENGRWEYLQIIKVHDTDKPVVSISVGDCEPAVKNATDNICYGHISLTADATDNCSPLDWLFYDYKIDAFNDGIGAHSGYDYKVGPLTRKEFAAGRTPLFHHNPAADDENNPFDASGNYPVGIHKICWFVEDGCGNIGTLCQLFEIKDCKAPTPYCLTGVITVPMPTSKCVTIWAKDLDRGSYDNCTDQDDLKFYFNGDPNATSITICCDDFVAAGANDELLVDVQMWVEDEEGNTDYCKTVIIVQDNQDVCPNTGSAKGRISGEFKTEDNQGTELVALGIYDPNTMMRQIITGQDGKYLFGDLKPNTYSITPDRNDNPLNGVSTKDIVKIQRHILGIETLNSGYKMIAADVNNSAAITASDVSEIRRLILGVTSSFSKVKSWTFVPKSYVFGANPFIAPRDSRLTITGTENFLEDFVAVKMGDVTTDARGHNVAGSSSRNNGKLHLEVDNNVTVAGELYKVAFKSSDFTNIAGYQFTLKFDRQSLAFEGIEAGALNVDESNFGTTQVSNGILTTSWDSKVAQSVDANATLFTVVFRASSQSNIGSLLAITSDVTTAEAYDAQLSIKDISLGVRTEKGVVESGVFELYQNSPNPFAKETVISYRLPQAGAAKLSIYDVTGKVLRVFELNGVKGMNTVKVQKSELNATGVLYYQLDAADHTATKRMVVIE